MVRKRWYLPWRDFDFQICHANSLISLLFFLFFYTPTYLFCFDVSLSRTVKRVSVYLFLVLFSPCVLCSLSSSDLWLSELWLRLVCIISSLSPLSIFSSRLLWTPRPPMGDHTKFANFRQKLWHQLSLRGTQMNIKEVKYRNAAWQRWEDYLVCTSTLHLLKCGPLSGRVGVAILCATLEGWVVVVHTDSFNLYDTQRTVWDRDNIHAFTGHPLKIQHRRNL